MILDIVLLFPFAWGAYQGYKNGIIQEIINFLHFMIAFVLCFKVSGIVLKFIDNNYFNFHDNTFAQVAFFFSLGLTIIALKQIGSHFKTETDYDLPGQWDNIVGAIFGLIKYAFIISFALWFLSAFGVMRDDLSRNGFVHVMVEKIGIYAVGGKNKQDISFAILQAL
ncbi:CvpA family protein [Eisenibacter elegans]|uniref:CvpA family protein n=1 Tax=Eisenibacter elegans TaxID=997 RepID=UPI0003FB7795|nr:CvpA family protein [Eisenibacter elegans]